MSGVWLMFTLWLFKSELRGWIVETYAQAVVKAERRMQELDDGDDV